MVVVECSELFKFVENQTLFQDQSLETLSLYPNPFDRFQIYYGGEKYQGVESSLRKSLLTNRFYIESEDYIPLSENKKIS